jgi:hypothetical protein
MPPRSVNGTSNYVYVLTRLDRRRPFEELRAALEEPSGVEVESPPPIDDRLPVARPAVVGAAFVTFGTIALSAPFTRSKA